MEPGLSDPVSFANASTVNIAGGTFNDIQGNSYTTYNYTYNIIGSNTLELLMHLVNSPEGSKNIFHRISPDLRNLVQLVAISSTAYKASRGQTPIGRLIRTAIDGRLSLSNRRLVALHQRMLSLPHRSVPLIHSVYGALYEWWTANEPEEITSIRWQLNEEMAAFGEYFYWASEVLFTAKPQVLWGDFEQLLQSAPMLLKDIHVEKITVVEPLQGEHLAIPIRFIKSFEDVHQVVKFACQGTVGASYIENRHYYLEDAAAEVSVIPQLHQFAEDFCQDGRVFEVTMQITQARRSPEGLFRCPRCGFDHSEAKRKPNGWNKDNWIRCHRCKIQFSTRVFVGPPMLLGEEESNTHEMPESTAEHDAFVLDDVEFVYDEGQDTAKVPIVAMFRRVALDIMKHTTIEELSHASVWKATGSQAERSFKGTFNESSIPGLDYSMAFNNACQQLFGQGGFVRAVEDPAHAGLWEATASVGDPSNNQTTQLGSARGLSRSHARSLAAHEGLTALQAMGSRMGPHDVPDEIMRTHASPSR
ncbi:hypothetical protein BKA70DRAFT_1445943 [Coprinopsis sp. MPI-PUGE-AT-0042]|nr:hypothetical protein BKA70DRAFT_1445943 [Coprinopsis sp. MPI-PUGE-AT-0042]